MASLFSLLLLSATPKPAPVFSKFFYTSMALVAVIALACLGFDLTKHGEAISSSIFLGVVGLMTAIEYAGDTGIIPGPMRDRLKAWKNEQGQ